MNSTAMSFSFATCQNILCESGAVKTLGEYCRQRHYQNVMVLTDPGIESLNLHQPLLQALHEANINVTLFTQVQADPAESVVLAAVAQAKQAKAQAVIGFGGGSSLDVAKLVAFLAEPNNQQALNDIYGVENARGQRLPLIQVPTTSGTGSEVTMVAIVTTGETTKMGAVSPIFLPDLAVLDATLTLGLPPHVTAATGIDAMVHAIEAYTSKHKKNPISDMLAQKALSLMGRNIQQAVKQGDDLAARENMLLGAMMAGQAFANAPVAAVHALAYPLGGHFHIPHGLSNSLVLPEVLKFNLSHGASAYAELAPFVFPQVNFSGTDENIAQQFIGELENLISELGLPTRLRDMDIPQSFLPRLAEDAMLQQRLLQNNPKDVDYDDALAIYQAAY